MPAGCIIADLQMPGLDGIALQQALAGSENPLPIAFLTGHGSIPTSVAAMRGGAEDFLARSAPKEDLLAAERALARDAREREDRARRRELLARFERLTPREREVREHMLRGHMNKNIAAELGIAEYFLKRPRTSLMGKLKINTVAERDSRQKPV